MTDRRFGLRALFWLTLFAGLVATLFSPSAALTAGFVLTLFTLIGLRVLIGRFAPDDLGP